MISPPNYSSEGGVGVESRGAALGNVPLVTFPERRHLVQTHIRLIPEFV